MPAAVGRSADSFSSGRAAFAVLQWERRAAHSKKSGKAAPIAAPQVPHADRAAAHSTTCGYLASHLLEAMITAFDDQSSL
jgi:hypothetical protein